MKEFLEYIVKNIVKNPEDVVINHSTTDENVHNFEITVNNDDMGILIGKSGKTIRSIREMCISKAIIDKIKINITINEQDKE